MKAIVIEEKENPLLKRKELMLSVDFDGKATPSKAEIQKLLAGQLNANAENLEITKILSEIGMPRGKVWVKIWKEKKVEIYTTKKKEETQQAPKEEAKVEGVKEESKQEEVKAEEKSE